MALTEGQNPDHLVIKRFIDEQFQEELAQHTRQLRYDDRLAECRLDRVATTRNGAPSRLPNANTTDGSASLAPTAGPIQEEGDPPAIEMEIGLYSGAQTGAYKPWSRPEHRSDSPNAPSAPAAEQPVEYTAIGPSEMSPPGAAGGSNSEDGEDNDDDARGHQRGRGKWGFKRNPAGGVNYDDDDGDDDDGDDAEDEGDEEDDEDRDYDELPGREHNEDYEDDVEDSDDDDDGLFSVPLSSARPLPSDQRPSLGSVPEPASLFTINWSART